MSTERHLFSFITKGSLLQRLILALIVLCMLMRGYGAAEGADTLSLGASLRGNETIVSQNGTFELGFFNPSGTNNWYLGIWYAKISQRAYVWVANRDRPVKNKAGILNLSTDGQLGLFDAEGESLWSPNNTKTASEAVLLDSGNFVMRTRETKSETVWESFDHPVDTWLPGMKFGRKSKFISWRNAVDPTPGIFSIEGDQSGLVQFVLNWNDSVQYWASGSWDGNVFSNIPEMSGIDYVFNISMENTTSDIYFKYTVSPTTNASRFVMDKTGAFLLYTLIDGNRWNMIWSQPRDQCEVYGLCGVYGTCSSNNIQFCSCLQGFQPRDEQAWDSKEWWSSGCVRQSPLNCDAKNSSEDQFIELKAWLPDNTNYQNHSYAATRNDCEKGCLADCSCTAFKYMSNICKIWRGDLLNMRNVLSRNDTTLFIRLAASEFGSSPSSSKRRRNIIGGAVGAAVATIVLAIFALLLWRRRRQRLRWSQRCADSSHPLLRTFASKELKIATNNFSHRLGGGEFFSIYKGLLGAKTPVSVKRMESSRDNEKHLQTELATVATLKHDNLIGFVGFCSEKSEIFIVYDYMPNGSLDSYLFDQTKSQYKVLDSNTRFRIALGAAKGIAHLHHNGIVHCDVKPENILLDANFCPKLAGFGLAKVAGREFRRDLTSIRGTRGYLAPEWMSGLPITAKADVYSFGMTLLELVAGRRNADLTVESSSMFFATWAASQTKRGIPLHSDGDVDWKGEEEEAEMRRATVVGGWCVEEREEARPSMWQVIQILEGAMDPHTPQTLRLLLDRGAKEVHLLPQ